MDDPTSSQQPGAETAERGKKGRTGMRVFVIALLGLLAVLVISYLLGYTGVIFVRPDWARQLGIPTSTPMCVRPTLMLGTASYPLETIDRPADGSLPVPGGETGTAWWVADTVSPFVILLSPGTEAAGMEPGEFMAVQSADCSREDFVLQEIQPGAPDVPGLLTQSSPGITIVEIAGGGSNGFVLLGQRPEETEVVPAEATDPNAVQAEISFGETKISKDGQSLITGLTILNIGDRPIIFDTEDISLTSYDKASIGPLSVKPSLPVEIQLGDSLEIEIVFPNPGGNSAVLQVFDVTFDLSY